MKKLISVGTVLLILCSSALPLTALCDQLCTDAQIKLTYPLFFNISSVVISIVLTFAASKGEAEVGKWLWTLFALCVPVFALNTFSICSKRSLLLFVSGVLYAVACFYLGYKLIRREWVRTVCAISVALMFIIFTPIAMAVSVFAPLMPSNDVIEKQYAPSGVRYAEVIDNNQGALGGSTIVKIYDYSYESVLITVTAEPREIHYGEWGERIKIEWINESKIIINEIEYEV